MKPSLPVTLTVLPALKAAGIKVSIRHKRFIFSHLHEASALFRYRRDMPNSQPPEPHGGETTVNLTFPDGGSYTGVAQCSLEDRFDRREGIRIALNRALFARKTYKSKYLKGTLTITGNSISVS